jgi:hypothetical protein
MRTRTATTIAGSAASLLLLGGVAYAAVQSVDDHPGPQVVIPSTSDDRHHARHGADDPVTHDANDDRNRNRNHARHGSDDPATHDLTDDSSGSGSNRGSGSISGSGSGGSGSDDSGSGHGGHGGHGGDD